MGFEWEALLLTTGPGDGERPFSGVTASGYSSSSLGILLRGLGRRMCRPLSTSPSNPNIDDDDDEDLVDSEGVPTLDAERETAEE